MAFDNLATFTFTQILASGEVLPLDVWRKIPAVLTIGAKNTENGGFFDYDLILDVADKSRGSNLYDDDGILVVQDKTTKEGGVFIKSSVFNTLMVNFINDAVDNSQAASDLVSQFNNQIASATNAMPEADRYVQILAAQFEAGSAGTDSQVIPLATASISFTEFPGLIFDENGNERLRKLTYLNESLYYTDSYFYLGGSRLYDIDSDMDVSNAPAFGTAKFQAQEDALVAAGKSYLTRSVDGDTGQTSMPLNDWWYIQPKPVDEWSLSVSSSGTSGSFTSSLFALTSSFSSSAEFGAVSGGFMGRYTPSGQGNSTVCYNGSNFNDGGVTFQIQISQVEGEGEYAPGEDLHPGFLLIENSTVSPVHYNEWPNPLFSGSSSVRSASFYFTPYPDLPFEQVTGEVLRDTITGSISSSGDRGTGEIRTLYWLKHTYNNSFTGSFGHFTRDQLKNQTGDASHYQLPYMHESYGGYRNERASHLYTDRYLSKPAPRGYYIQSSSFTSQSKANMANQYGSANHTGSFYVMGVFDNPYITQFVPLGYQDRLLPIGYTSSQHNDPGLHTLVWMRSSRKATCLFLKKYDDTVEVGGHGSQPQTDRFNIVGATTKLNIPYS
jgi:hypothetical protein